MSEFVECRGCGFVLQAFDAAKAVPNHWEVCPDCGETDFAFPDG